MSTGIAAETAYILTIEFDGGGTGSLAAYLNGDLISTLTGLGALGVNPGGTEEIGIGNINGATRFDNGTSTGSESFDGSIAEFIYCNEPSGFTTADRNQVESYLAFKYGITLDQSVATVYTNASGSVIFNTTISASVGGYLEYNNDIAGIGRDDASAFLQSKSKSENSDAIVTIERTSASGIGTDDTWLIWGNDGGLTSTSSIVSLPDTVLERIERVWRVAEVSSMGVTDITFDISGIAGVSNNPDDFSLLIADNTSSGDFSAATVITGAMINGDSYIL